MKFVPLGVIFTGTRRLNFLPGQIALMIMKSNAERRRQIARSVALLRTLSKREGTTSIYGFAEKYDALASPMNPTKDQGKNGWQALFNGTRPVSASRLRALSSVEAWSDAINLFENGPANGSMPFCVELDNLKDTDAPIHQPAAMLVAAD